MQLRHLVASVALLLTSCGDQGRVAGNAGDIGNGLAAGIVVRPDGSPAFRARVECLPIDSKPWESQAPGWTTTTDSTGRFTCRELPEGAVGIWVHAGTDLTHWRSDIATPTLSQLKVDTLAPPGTLHVALPPSSTGTLYLTGLRIMYMVNGEGEIMFAGIPAGWQGSLILLRSEAGADRLVIGSGLSVPSGSTDSVGYSANTSRLRVRLPGGLKAAIHSFPLLVRIGSSWSGFASVLADGSDLRLRSANGKELPLTLAFWDKNGRTGSFWTFLDSIPAPGDSIDLILDYGLPIRSATPSQAFTAGGGWSAVWPLGDTGTVVRERLGRFPGTSTALGRSEGITGSASSFDGTMSKVVILGSSHGALALPSGGPYTMSCWAKLRTYTFSRFLMGYGDRNTALKYVGNTSSSNKNTWQLRDFRDVPVGVNLIQGAADTAVWTHLAATVEGDSVRFFLDGVRQTAAVGFDRSDLPRSRVDFAIGASLDSLGAGSYYFPGDLSEVWIHSVVRSTDWIRFAATNQAPAAVAAQPLP